MFIKLQSSCTSTTFYDDICCSRCEDISLANYVYALPQFCTLNHKSSCSCSALVSVAQNVLQNGFVLLSEAFRLAFPTVTYHSHNAKHRLLQLPLVALRIGSPESGKSEIFLFEHFPGINYRQFLHLFNAFHTEKYSQNLTFSKQQLKDILSIAQNDRERECIRYTAFAVPGLSATGARKQFGLDRITERAQQVENAIEEAKAIPSAIESISKIQEKTALAQFGVKFSDESDSSLDDGVASESDSEVRSSPQPMSSPPSDADLIQLLKSAQFNWFELAC